MHSIDRLRIQLLALLCASVAAMTACGGGGAHSESDGKAEEHAAPSSVGHSDDADSAHSEERPSASLSHGGDTPIFDFRVLARPENVHYPVHRARWTGDIDLPRSKFQSMLIEVEFELIDEKAAAAFDPESSDYHILSDAIRQVFHMRRSNEIAGAASMERRREEVIQALNRLFGATVVREAYFANYSLGDG